ncbi:MULTISPECIES: hypothetical protein [unclassified Microbacterium]|uniref:hypothetical protein n=1 Tax=unclassified Microbacterium TaxID=2609290 RepID=UPI0012F84885|nr:MULTISPECIES: hypothetical protein [unclassified Microbacterium]
MAVVASGAQGRTDISMPLTTGAPMPPNDGDAQSEDELRGQLLRIEEEHAALLSSTIGMVSVGNGELAERANELERKADVIRARLGEPTRHPPEPPRRRVILGWVTLCAAVVAIIALVLLLPH